MTENDLTEGQIALALHIEDQMKVGGYVLISAREIHELFNNKDALSFILSTNAWQIKFDRVLELVVFTDSGFAKTLPISEVRQQIRARERRARRKNK